MKFSKYNRFYNEYYKWQNICSEGTWKIASPSDFEGFLPEKFLTKTNSVLIMASMSSNSSVFVANFNRVDRSASAIDQEPYILAFDHAGSVTYGGFVHHGNWQGRTTIPEQGFLNSIAASGIQAHYPLEELPTASSGYLDELSVNSQKTAFWTSLSALKK